MDLGVFKTADVIALNLVGLATLSYVCRVTIVSIIVDLFEILEGYREAKRKQKKGDQL